MARHKDILKSHHPEMLFTFDEETNFVSVSNNQASGFYLDENVYQNMAHATIFRVNNDGYDYGYNTKTIVPNERFSTFTSYSYGGTKTIGNRADLSLDVEVDPECMTSTIGNFSTSFQIKLSDFSSNSNITNTYLDNESLKRYQLLMVRVSDNLILGRGEFSLTKNAMTMSVNHTLLYNPNLTRTRTQVDPITNEEIIITEPAPQTVHVAFILVYDRLRYVKSNVTRNNEWSSGTISIVNAFYNDIVGGYLYLNDNPLHNPNDTECSANDILSYVKYHTSSYDNLPVNKNGIIVATQVKAFKEFKMIFDKTKDGLALGVEDVNYPTRYPDRDFNSLKINIHSVASSTKGGSNFPKYEYLSFNDENDSQNIFYWTHITGSTNIVFHVSLNRIPDILKFSLMNSSISSGIWYDVISINNFKICARPVGNALRIGVLINGYTTSASYDIMDSQIYSFVVNYNRSESVHKITMFVNGEIVVMNSNVPNNAKYIGSLIKENDNNIHIGTDGHKRPYIFTKNLTYDNASLYTSLPTGTWGTIVSSQNEYAFVNILPVKIMLDNFAVYNGKQFNQDQSRELYISCYSYNDILIRLGLSSRYEFKKLYNEYSYISYNEENYGWVRKIVDDARWVKSNPYSTSSSMSSDDSYSLHLYGKNIEIVDVKDHGIFNTAISLKNNAHLSTRNNILYGSPNGKTTSFWIKTESNRKQTILSSVSHILPFTGINMYIQSGYITLDFGNKTITTRNSYSDGKWHRVVLQFKPHDSGTNNGFIRLIIDQNFSHEFPLSTTSGYTNSDWTDYWTVKIGNDLIGDLGYNGLIADMQVFNSIVDPYYLNYLYQNKQYFNASGTIYFNNLPTNTRVRIYNHLTGQLLAQTQTDENGYFEYKNEETYTIDVVVLDNRNNMENYQTFTGIIINSK